MSDDDERVQGQAPIEIDADRVDAVVEPILDELERTAQHLTDPRPTGQASRRPEPPGRGPRDAATGAVDFGLRLVERAALFPRRVVQGLIGFAPQGGTPPQAASQPRQVPQASAGTGFRFTEARTTQRSPGRSVRSPLAGNPRMVTGAYRPGPQGRPGRRTRLRVTVHNHSSMAVSARFRSSDLVSRTGGSIPASAVTFDPPALNLRPRSSADIAITVHIPFGQPAGRYTGLVEAGERVRTVVELHVG